MMRYLKIVSLILLLVLSSGCVKKEEKVPSISLMSGEIFKEEKSFGRSFHLSFWLKPESNYYGSTILKIKSGEEMVSLLANSEDADFHSTGIALVHDNGSLYKDGVSTLETYNYHYIVIQFIENTFFLYLDGKFLGEKTFSNTFNLSNVTFTFGSEYFKGLFEGICFKDGFLKEEEIKEEYETRIDKRMHIIDYPEHFKQNARGKVALPMSDFDVLYTSDSPYLEVQGKYLKFKENTTPDDETVTLHATTNIDGIDVSKDIVFTVKGKNEENTLSYARSVVDHQLEYVISESNRFAKEVEGCQISYGVVEGAATYDEEQSSFIKTSENEKEIIKVRATIKLGTKEEIIEKEVVLMDEYVAYLLTYFDGHDGWPEHLTGEESIYFALSKDLKNWEKLGTKSPISSKEGSGRFRDPYIGRDKDGDIVITATEAYRNPGMYVIQSKDFINFDTSHISFTGADRSLKLDGTKTWAPEFIYDSEKDLYTILFSDPDKDNESIFAADTKDFQKFSYPYIYFHAGYDVIDANIEMIDNQYYLFYKDERNATIHYAISDTLNQPVWQIYDDIAKNDGYPAEGPFVFYDHRTGSSYLFLDSFKESLIYSCVMYKWKDTVDAYPDVDMGLSALGGVRHFSVIELTEKEYERIKAYYE